MTTAVVTRANELIDAASTVASPPLVYDRLMKVMADPRAGIADIGRVISEDQALTARVLRLVNSALFSLPWKVDTVTEAVRVVGISQIRDLATATSIISMFDDLPEELVNPSSFWGHSLGCGTLARALARQRGEDNPERFLVAGLLHDIGRLIMLVYAAEQMREALHESRRTGIGLTESERAHVGCDHTLVGGKLLAKWNFPTALEQAVRYHHDPRRADRFPVEAATVHVADLMASILGWGSSGRITAPELVPAAWDMLAVDPAALPGILEDAEQQWLAVVHLIEDDCAA